MMQSDRDQGSTPKTATEAGLSVSQNLIEYYVMGEVERRYNRLPEQTKDFVSKSDIVAYALNRLPAMYATTRRGYFRQSSEIKDRFAKEISQVVLQGFVAVKADPFRFSKPLEKRDDVGAQNALEKLRHVLGDRSITWENVAEAVQSRLAEKNKTSNMWTPNANASAKFDWTPIALRNLSEQS